MNVFNEEAFLHHLKSTCVLLSAVCWSLWGLDGHWDDDESVSGGEEDDEDEDESLCEFVFSFSLLFERPDSDRSNGASSSSTLRFCPKILFGCVAETFHWGGAVTASVTLFSLLSACSDRFLRDKGRRPLGVGPCVRDWWPLLGGTNLGKRSMFELGIGVWLGWTAIPLPTPEPPAATVTQSVDSESGHGIDRRPVLIGSGRKGTGAWICCRLLRSSEATEEKIGLFFSRLRGDGREGDKGECLCSTESTLEDLWMHKEKN